MPRRRSNARSSSSWDLSMEARERARASSVCQVCKWRGCLSVTSRLANVGDGLLVAATVSAYKTRTPRSWCSCSWCAPRDWAADNDCVVRPLRVYGISYLPDNASLRRRLDRQHRRSGWSEAYPPASDIAKARILSLSLFCSLKDYNWDSHRRELTLDGGGGGGAR